MVPEEFVASTNVSSPWCLWTLRQERTYRLVRQLARAVELELSSRFRYLGTSRGLCLTQFAKDGKEQPQDSVRISGPTMIRPLGRFDILTLELPLDITHQGKALRTKQLFIRATFPLRNSSLTVSCHSGLIIKSKSSVRANFIDVEGHVVDGRVHGRIHTEQAVQFVYPSFSHALDSCLHEKETRLALQDDLRQDKRGG